MIDPTDIDKLRMLIPHWIEHNEGHAAEFRKWATKLDQVDDILAAREELLNRGVELGEVRSAAPGVWVCDGEDPEGNKLSIESHE